MFVTNLQQRAGVALVLGGLAVNPWLVGYVATDDGAIDQGAVVAGLLFLSLAGVLGGLQLLWKWVDPLSWQRPVGLLRGTVAVAIAAAAIAGTHWRVTSYTSGHQHDHTIEVMAGHEHGDTSAETQWAEDFYRRSLAAAVKHGWFDIKTALAQGFQVDPVNGTHFPSRQNLFDDVVLDPERPEWLIYNDGPDGKTLTGLMFFTRELEDVGPRPGGSLTQWHYHPYDVPRCAIEGIWTVAKTDDQGRCADGIPVTRTPEMLHMWLIDHPLGRFTSMQFLPTNPSDGWFSASTLHPIAVHFAIALFIIAVLLDAAAIVTRRAAYHHAAWLNLVLAGVAATAAVASGMQSEIGLFLGHEAHATLDSHKLLAYGSLAGILSLMGWRYALRGRFPGKRAAMLYSALSLAAVGAIAAAGYYGGEMVYRHGAAVQAVDRFARDRYFNQVRQIYRHDPSLGVDPGTGPAEHGEHSPAPSHSGH